MLLYPFAVVLAMWLGLEQARKKILGDMASVYFVSVAGPELINDFFGSQAIVKSKVKYNV